MRSRDERTAKNEVLFRAVNREIEQASRDVGDGELEVLCECGRDGCSGLVRLTVNEYDRIHGQQDRFVVLPGHQTPAIETVVEEHELFFIVDKFGEAEDIATRG